MGTVELAVVGLAGSGVGTALGMPMVWPGQGRTTAVRLMGWWLLTAAVIGALISCRVIGLLPATVAVDHAINLLGFGAYPLLYLWIRQDVGQPARPGEAWWLWLPAAIYGVVLVAKAMLGVSTGVPFQWILPVVIGFTALCAGPVLRHPDHGRSSIVPARAIVAFLVLLNTSQVVRLLFGDLPLVPAAVPFTMATGFVALVGLVVWSALETGAAVEARPAAPRYEHSGLEEEVARALLGEITRTLSARRLFTDPGLTLARLATEIGATPHQVSEALNRHGTVSFHELLSRYRVEEVKVQLLAPASDRFTIEGIGASAGFGSRSALYAAFRRIEGMTPAEFRARRRRQE